MQNFEEKYLNSITQQVNNVQEQIEILDELYKDYILEKNLRLTCCDSLKNLSMYYYEQILHKLGYSQSKCALQNRMSVRLLICIVAMVFPSCLHHVAAFQTTKIPSRIDNPCLHQNLVIPSLPHGSIRLSSSTQLNSWNSDEIVGPDRLKSCIPYMVCIM